VSVRAITLARLEACDAKRNKTSQNAIFIKMAFCMVRFGLLVESAQASPPACLIALKSFSDVAVLNDCALLKGQGFSA
jgi:hypothetical protein